MKHKFTKNGNLQITFQSMQEVAMFVGAFDCEPNAQSLYQKARLNDEELPAVVFNETDEPGTYEAWHAAAGWLMEDV